MRTALRSPQLYRRQVGALIIGTTIPWVGNVIYLLNASPWPGLDLTPLAFMLTGLAIAWGLFRFQMLDLVPVAREALIESMSDGVLLLDEHNRVVDINPAACRMIGCSATSAVGQPVAAILSKWRDLVERYRDMPEAQAEITVNGIQWQDLRISPLYDRRKKLTGRLIALRDITERKLAEEALRHRAREMAALYDTSLEINALTALVPLLRSIVERAARLLNVRLGGLYLLTPDGESLELVVSHNLPANYRAATLRLGEGLSGRVAQTGEPMMVEDYCLWEGQVPLDTDSPLRRALGMPLKTRNKVIGVIHMVDDLQAGPFSEEAVRLVRLFADQAAIAVEKARLYEETCQRAERLALLNTISTEINLPLELNAVLQACVDGLARALQVDQTGLALLDEARHSLAVVTEHTAPGSPSAVGFELPVAGNLSMERVLTTKMSLAIASAQSDPLLASVREVMVQRRVQSILIVPLVVRDEVVGTIGCDAIAAPRHFTLEDIELAETIANLVAVRIEQARLFEAERHALQQAEARVADLDQHERYLTLLNDITQAAISAPSLTDLFQVLADHLGELFDAEGAYITLWDEARQATLPAAAFGQLRETYTTLRVEADEVTMTASVLRAGHVLATEDVFHSPYLSPRIAALFPARSLLGLPLIADGRKLGAALINYNQPHRFSPDEIARGERVARQIALAVAKTQLRAEALQRAANLNALIEASRDGVILVGLDMRILVANVPALRLLRLPDRPEAWVGRPVMDGLKVLSRWSRRAARVILAEIRRLQNGDQAPGEGEYDISPCTLHWLNLPVQVGDTPLGRLIVLRDVTDERAVERLREDMTSMLVHDLRNPLCTISTALELLRSEMADDFSADQRHVLDIMGSQALKMRELVNRILEIGQLERQQALLAARRAPIELAHLIGQVLELQAPQASAKGVRLESDVPPDLPPAWADAELIGRVLQNLVDNAVKFTPPGGLVRVAARTGESEGRPALLVSVTDTGSGIPDEIRSRLFQKFVRGKQLERGSGLGLAFCKLAVEAHDGRIEVESVPGRGATFAFSLNTTPNT